MNQENIAENVLFSVVVSESKQVSATEVLTSFRPFDSWDQVKPLFSGNAVGKPVPVMVEGTYYVKQGQGPDGKDRFREVKFSADDIKRLSAKQPRDVPFNYDHRRAPGADGVKGWLRFGRAGENSLHYVGTVTTPAGESLTALFATPELGDEAQRMVTGGIYRDLSIEYRALDDVITGCALTSYPVMRNLQFSDLDSTEEPETVPVAVPEVVPVPEDTRQPDRLAENPEEEMDADKIKALPLEQRKAILNELLGGFGLDLDGLVNMGEQFQQSQAKNQQTRYQLALDKAEQYILKLIGDTHFGLTDESATLAQEALAWSEVQDTVHFGSTEGDVAVPDLPGAIRTLLGVIGKQGQMIKILGGEQRAVDEDGTANFGDVTPDVEKPEDKIDTGRVKGLTALAKSLIK